MAAVSMNAPCVESVGPGLKMPSCSRIAAEWASISFCRLMNRTPGTLSQALPRFQGNVAAAGWLTAPVRPRQIQSDSEASDVCELTAPVID